MVTKIRFDDLEERMKGFEQSRHLTIDSSHWIVIRLDGRGFSKFTLQYAKPFDQQFHQIMVQTAQTVLRDLIGIYAYTQSDEISILLPPNWRQFNRRIEKLVSTSASLASSVVSIATQRAVQFDGRIWSSDSSEDVRDYFKWRQWDSRRNALEGWCYWTLRHHGNTVGEATSRLKNLTVNEKLDLLAQQGVAFDLVPKWQVHGVGIRWVKENRIGVDPRSGKQCEAVRRVLQTVEDLNDHRDAVNQAVIHALENPID